MFVLVFAVPALLVVVLGYVVGHAVWSWLGGLADDALGTSLAPAAEAVGWLTGLLTLVLTARLLVALRRWSAASGRRQRPPPDDGSGSGRSAGSPRQS